VQDAWKREQPLTVHGWVYGLKDGLVRDLDISIGNNDELSEKYTVSIKSRSTGLRK
jgi:carbonic anhydrase